jgi:hypothetical protein
MSDKHTQHHFVLHYDRELGAWAIDQSTLYTLFEDGDVWDKSEDAWRMHYDEDENAEESFFQEVLEETLESTVQLLNSRMPEVAK